MKMQFLLKSKNINYLKLHSSSHEATVVQLFQKDSTF
jgi:hypothetical protein